MKMNYVVGYDGSASSRRAVEFALKCAKANDASLSIAHVLEWSPYSFLTPTELEERHMRRNEELARAKSSVIDPIVEELSDQGVEITTVMQYGHVAETLSRIAEEQAAEQIFIGRTGDGELVSRIFGSAAGALAQMAPVPCTLVP